MNVVAIIQARMGSSRLPGKVLADIAGKPMLWYIVERVKRASTVQQVVVATSDQLADDVIAQCCAEMEITCFRGSEEDVLDRYYQAARTHAADAVVRITADCPFIDPAVVDRVVTAFCGGQYDYVTNTLYYTYPDGLDVEVFSFAALQQSWQTTTNPVEREHVTSHLRTSGQFRLHNVESPLDYAGWRYRWVVDTPADLEFVRRVYGQLAAPLRAGVAEVHALLQQRPELLNHQDTSVANEGYYTSLYAYAVPGSAPARLVARSQDWLSRAQKVIPGCAQTFSKGPNQYVQGVSPVFLQRGKGCLVWDVDGNEYIDYVQGLLPNILGYAHDEVNAAVVAQLAEGNTFSLPHPIEVELAERLTTLIPCAEMVRFGKNGSDVTSGAIRAARAHTGRERVACCGYHGWQDWYIGSTTRNAGVPVGVRAQTHPFPYNDVAALDATLSAHPGEFAAVIMEPVNFVPPADGYLQAVKDTAHRHGALLIFDEICTGFRFGLGGAQQRYGVTPDLACFGKAMGNGFPIACVVGRADVMQVFTEIFFSFTFAGEVSAMVAALKVLDILEHTDALARMVNHGTHLKEGVNVLAHEAGLSSRVTCVGEPVWSLIQFRDEAGQDSLLLRSLFQQEIVKRGILTPASHNMTAAHDGVIVERTLEVYAVVLKTLAGWLAEPDLAQFLEGDMIQPVFRVR